MSGFALTYGDKERRFHITKLLHTGHVLFGCLSALLYLIAHEANFLSHQYLLLLQHIMIVSHDNISLYHTTSYQILLVKNYACTTHLYIAYKGQLN